MNMAQLCTCKYTCHQSLLLYFFIVDYVHAHQHSHISSEQCKRAGKLRTTLELNNLNICMILQLKKCSDPEDTGSEMRVLVQLFCDCNY